MCKSLFNYYSKHIIIYFISFCLSVSFILYSFCPVKVSAISTADEFLEAVETEIERLSNAYEVGLVVGTILPTVDTFTATAGIYGLMNSYEYYQMKYFSDESASPYFEIPDNQFVCSGVYRTSANGDLFPCNLYPMSGRENQIVAVGKHFNVQCSIINVSDAWYIEPVFSVDNYNIYVGGRAAGNTSGRSYTVKYIDSSNYLDAYSRSVGASGASIQVRCSRTNIPVLARGDNLTSSIVLCGYGVTNQLPTGTISRSQPWNYYNNVLLPYVHNTYGNNDDINYWLPFGGQPWLPNQDPTEPDRPGFVDLPSGQPVVPYVPGTPTDIPIEIDTDGNTEIYEIYSPSTNQITINGVAFIIGAGAFGAAGAAGAAGGVYANGQISIGGTPFDIPSFDLDIPGFDVPISIPDSTTIQLGDLQFHFNSDGTITIGDMTFNLPLGEPETIAVGADTYLVEYNLPVFDTFYIPDETIPHVSLSNYSDGISIIWESVYDLLTDTGLLPLVYIMFGMGVVSFVLWKIGG